MSVYPNNTWAAPGFMSMYRLYGRPFDTNAPFNGSTGAQRGALTGALLRTAGFPDGYVGVPLLPIVAGGMAGGGTLTVYGAGDALSGGPIAGAGTLGLEGDGDLALVVSMAGDGSFVVSGAGGLALTVAMDGAGNVTLTGSAGLSLIVPFEGAGSVALSGAADLKGRLSLEAGAETTGELTAEQVAQAVWAALAAANDAPGTMGELLSTAGSGGLSPAQVAMLTELWRMRGLDPANPVTVTTTTETAGDVELAISGDGVTTSTLTRQP